MFCIWDEREDEEAAEKLGAIYRYVLRGPKQEQLVKHEGSAITLRRNDTLCMEPSGWLNDEVINMYVALLLERDLRLRNFSQQSGSLQGPSLRDIPVVELSEAGE